MIGRFQRFVNPQAGSVDPEAQSRQDLTSEVGDVKNLSFETRIYCFVGCFILSMVCSVLGSPLLMVGKLTGFAVMVSLGSVISICGTFFLSGPLKQLKKMFEPTRLVATLVFLAMIVLTLVAGLILRNPVLALICIIAQYLAMAWYSLSYIPYASALMTPAIHLKTGHHKSFHKDHHHHQTHRHHHRSNTVSANPLHNNNSHHNSAAKTQNVQQQQYKKPVQLSPLARLRHWLFPSTSSSSASWCEVESGGGGGTSLNRHNCHHHHHQQQPPPYGHPNVEGADTGGGANGIQHPHQKLANGATGFSVEPVVYIQSKTRRLAFGSSQNLTNKSYESGLRDETYVRHLQEFYNNSTFTRIAKIFSAGVLLVAFLMFISELIRRQEQRLEKEGMAAAGNVAASGPFDDDNGG